jgi:hypothetical protein
MLGLKRPYRRTCRQFPDGSYTNSGQGQYIEHPKFAKDAEKYVRAFLLIQKDMQNLFDYVHPSSQNLECYSHRIHELLLRASIEVEANLKAILADNGYQRSDGRWWTMEDYKKIEQSHRLSEYQVKVPYWDGEQYSLRTPFADWTAKGGTEWYNAYNATKHDRHESFARANFGAALSAICGVVAVLSAQFHSRSFVPGPDVLAIGGWDTEGFENAIGDFFLVKCPDQWPAEERYTFTYEEWQQMRQEPDPFQNFPYL